MLAAIVRPLDMTSIRVGNREYAKQNGAYGLTTLRPRHVSVSGTEIRFCFRGKSGIAHRVVVDEPRLARVVRRLLDLAGCGEARQAPAQRLYRLLTQTATTTVRATKVRNGTKSINRS